MTEKEKDIHVRIERRFKGHEDDEIMMALKEIATRYLINQLRAKSG